jgi:hypothetical protein
VRQGRGSSLRAWQGLPRASSAAAETGAPFLERREGNPAMLRSSSTLTDRPGGHETRMRRATGESGHTPIPTGRPSSFEGSHSCAAQASAQVPRLAQPRAPHGCSGASTKAHSSIKRAGLSGPHAVLLRLNPTNVPPRARGHSNRAVRASQRSARASAAVTWPPPPTAHPRSVIIASRLLVQVQVLEVWRRQVDGRAWLASSRYGLANRVDDPLNAVLRGGNSSQVLLQQLDLRCAHTGRHSLSTCRRSRRVV